MTQRQSNALWISIILLIGSLGLSAQPSVLKGKTEQAYIEALELYKKGQYGNSQRLFDKVVSMDYTYPREIRANASYYSALCSMNLYNNDAKQRVNDFARDYPLNPLVNRLHLEYAFNRFSLKRYKDATEQFEAVDPYRLPKSKKAEYDFKKAYAYLSLEEYSKAKPLFAGLTDKESPYQVSARYYYAHLLYKEKNYTEALKFFEPLQQDESFGPLVPYYLAHIYYDLNDYEKLLEVGEDLVENATPSRAPEIAKLVGDAFFNKGEYGNALRYLELYREKGGKMSQRDHFELGYCYYQAKNYEQAISSFNKIVSNNGKDDLQQNAWYHLGDSYLKTGDKHRAMTAFKAASEKEASPTIREDAFFNYAKLAYETSDPFQDAIQTLNAYLKTYPKSPKRAEVNKYLANLYITTKDYEKAMEAIKETGLEDPAMQEAYQKIAFFRASELFKVGRLNAAIKKYDESLRYDINKSIAALANYWKAEAYYGLRDYDEALKSIENFRKVNGAFNLSEYNQSYYQSAYCYYKKFDFEKAAADFRRYLRDAGNGDLRSDAYLRLGDSYLLTGGYIAATDFYQKAIDQRTSQADYASYKKAQCLGLAGKNEQKISELRGLIKKYPQSEYLEISRYEIGLTQLQEERYAEAISSMKEFKMKHPESPLVAKADVQIGLAYSNTDRNEEALSSYKSVVAEHPGSNESMEAIGLARLIYARENRIDDYLDWVDGLDFVNFSKSSLDSTSFSSAFDQYSSGDCKAAIDALESYLYRFKKGIFALRAQYYLADCARRSGRDDIAKTSYEQILKFKLNDYTIEAHDYLAGVALKEKRYVDARELYEAYLSIAQNRTQEIEARLGLMECEYELGDYPKSSQHASVLLGQQGVESEDMVKSRRIAALSYYQLEQWERSLENLDKLLENTAGDQRAEAYYYKAEVLNRRGQYEASNEVVFKLIEELPGYKEWKMKALILSARNYWKQEDIFQANYTLDFVVQSAYDQASIDEANALKAEIAEYEKEQEAIRQQMLENSTDSLKLNNGDGMIIIDQKEEPQDTTTQRN